jgi:ABC-type transport system involved in cytochrome bd biosynthesis fused ATPase/permease subunit
MVNPDQRHHRRFRSRSGVRPWLIAVLVPLVAGAVVAVVAGNITAGLAAGMALIGLSGVLLVSWVFYEVGLSEDRQRARERGRRED